MRFPLTLFLFLSILSLFCSDLASAQCFDDQKSSLLTLFGSAPILSWTPNTDCCVWKGVTCDPSGHVMSLDLTNFSIRDSINSTSLISLSSLRSLNLSHNLFDSSIPVSLSGLSKLTHLNLSNSGFTGQVPVEISRIKSLESLDLSYSAFDSIWSLLFPSPDLGFVVGNLSGLRELILDGVDISSPAPQTLGGLANLTSLNLSLCNLIGEFPMKIFQLQNLETIDLSGNSLLSGTLPEFSSNSRLQILSLSHTNFFGELPSSFGNLRYLQRLELSRCSFSGKVPLSLGTITQLVHLDFSSNSFSGNIPSLENLSQLVHLDLSWNSFSGEILSLENLTQLVLLDLSSNSFTGKIPSLENLTQLVQLNLTSNEFSGRIPSLKNLTQLVLVDLSSNRFNGRIPYLGSLKNVVEIALSNNDLSGAIDSTFGDGLVSLTKLYLHNNSLTGKIPSSLFTLPSLQYLDLKQNQFDAPLGEFGNASSSLIYLDLSNNQVRGPIPSSMFQLIGLNMLSLSSNEFSGNMDFAILQNLTNLSDLNLSNNSLSINTSGINSPLPQFFSLQLSSCNLWEFPDFLRNQSELVNLDLSNNKIDGEIPSWIWNIGNWSLTYLNISHNLLYSLELPTVDLSLSLITVLDLHSNKLQGSIPIPPPSINVLDYSRNNFTSVIPTNISLYLSHTYFFSLSENNMHGEIPSSICNTSLSGLDLSNNNLSGSIPHCLCEMDTLRVLNLGKNNLHGVIPQSFGDGCSLETLNLNRNQLQGSLPESLAYCKQLEVLNIGNNRINDSFPSWLWSLQQLRVLILRSNMFFGPIQHPKDRNAFSKLHIIDLSSNGFTGNLGFEWFQNLRGIMGDEDQDQQILKFGVFEFDAVYYQESVTVTLKGLELEYVKILTIFNAVDLSNNRFHGSIPQEIGNLKSLIVLNISHNEFSGPIPSSFGNLRQLESLDLSVNQLSGEIPTELTALTFLAVLNLSRNHFTGRIPQLQQFLTFGNNSFEGNPGLCGLPLSRQCEAPWQPGSTILSSRNNFDWQFFLSVGLGFGIGVWMVMGPLIFWTRLRRWYFKHVDRILFELKVWRDRHVHRAKYCCTKSERI
ncbi:receptor-like protein 12 [Cinnamomum micranthum f. kanehirae]|uniref:Receptor-like protein 12 n=1 Tax=Cinnamomum micranthum f. kanehirae TaxID=337451 RepID=A0A443NK20_9MAGN|nr:receptor-like protein 12 [Cinnamomum micranthum f. kanehirae]